MKVYKLLWLILKSQRYKFTQKLNFSELEAGFIENNIDVKYDRISSPSGIRRTFTWNIDHYPYDLRNKHEWIQYCRTLDRKEIKRLYKEISKEDLDAAELYAFLIDDKDPQMIEKFHDELDKIQAKENEKEQVMHRGYYGVDISKPKSTAKGYKRIAEIFAKIKSL